MVAEEVLRVATPKELVKYLRDLRKPSSKESEKLKELLPRFTHEEVALIAGSLLMTDKKGTDNKHKIFWDGGGRCQDGFDRAMRKALQSQAARLQQGAGADALLRQQQLRQQQLDQQQQMKRAQQQHQQRAHAQLEMSRTLDAERLRRAEAALAQQRIAALEAQQQLQFEVQLANVSGSKALEPLAAKMQHGADERLREQQLREQQLQQEQRRRHAQQAEQMRAQAQREMARAFDAQSIIEAEDKLNQQILRTFAARERQQYEIEVAITAGSSGAPLSAPRGSPLPATPLSAALRRSSSCGSAASPLSVEKAQLRASLAAVREELARAREQASDDTGDAEPTRASLLAEATKTAEDILRLERELESEKQAKVHLEGELKVEKQAQTKVAERVLQLERELEREKEARGEAEARTVAAEARAYQAEATCVEAEAERDEANAMAAKAIRNATAAPRPPLQPLAQ